MNGRGLHRGEGASLLPLFQARGERVVLGGRGLRQEGAWLLEGGACGRASVSLLRVGADQEDHADGRGDWEGGGRCPRHHLYPPGHLGPRTPGSPPPDTWVPGHLSPPHAGCLGPSHAGHLGPWTVGCPPPPWTPGSLAIRVPPTQDTWVPGYLGPPNAGHLGPQTVGSVCRFPPPPPQTPGSLAIGVPPTPDTWVLSWSPGSPLAIG